MNIPTVSDLIVGTLRSAEVERVRGLPGGSLTGVTEVLRSRGAIERVHVRHGESAAFAARADFSRSAAFALANME